MTRDAQARLEARLVAVARANPEMTARQLAERLSLDRDTVRRWCHRLGLTPPVYEGLTKRGHGAVARRARRQA